MKIKNITMRAACDAKFSSSLQNSMSVLRCTLLPRNARQQIYPRRSLTLLWPESPHRRHRFRHRAYQATNNPWIFYPTCLVVLGAAGFIGYNTSQPFRHTALAVVRCSRVAGECTRLSGHRCTLHISQVPQYSVASIIRPL